MPHLFLLLCLLSAGLLRAQEIPYFFSTLSLPDTAYRWDKAVLPDNLGNLYLAGVVVYPAPENIGIVITKINPKREVLWSKRYRVSCKRTYLGLLADGNILVSWGDNNYAGYFKIDPAGNILWAKFFPVSSTVYRPNIYAIHPVSDGCLLAGSKDNQPLISEINLDGTIKWATVLQDSVTPIDIKNYYFTDIWVEADGGIMVIGVVGVEPYGFDGLLAAFDAVGQFKWCKRYPRFGIEKLGPMAGGRWLLAGSRFDDATPVGMEVLLADSIGTVIWAKKADSQVNNGFWHYGGLLTDSLQKALVFLSDRYLGSLTTDYSMRIAQINLDGAVVQTKTKVKMPTLLMLTLTDFKYDHTGNIVAAGNYWEYADTHPGHQSIRALVARFSSDLEPMGCCLQEENFALTNVVQPMFDFKQPSLSGVAVEEDPSIVWYDTRPGMEFLCRSSNLSFTALDTLLCPGDCVNFALIYPDSSLTYTWAFPGGSPATASGPMPGPVCFDSKGEKIISVTAEDSCETYTATRHINVRSDSTSLAFTVSDASICPGECIRVDLVNPDSLLHYTWTFNDAALGVAAGLQPGPVCFGREGEKIVSVTAPDLCRAATDTLHVMVKSDWLPNAFTPNRDNLNETFKPISLCNFSTYELKIYNRWGQQVFVTTDALTGWDGQFRDQEAPSDVYVWIINYVLVRDGKTVTYRDSGEVTLIR